jgi:hypothetical protein
MPRPHSQAMCDRARRLSEVHGKLSIVSRITGIPAPSLRSMRERGWKAPKTTRPFRPMPTDYAIQRTRLGFRGSREHYKTWSYCIQRWDRELWITNQGGLAVSSAACSKEADGRTGG